ncbi:MAG: hypothetical protein QGI77_08335, partial [Roseibacillus sp.]|nr:hypothetical protein [Roseibacillus sp.]
MFCLPAILLSPSCEEKEVLPASSRAAVEPDEIVRQVVRSEELTRELTPALRALAGSLVSGSRKELPEEVTGEGTRAFFEDLLEDGAQWENASFGIVSSELNQSSFTITTKFEGMRRGSSGAVVGVQAKLQMNWTLGEDGWRLVDWEWLRIKEDRATDPLFEEVLDEALPDGITRDAVRRSLQEELTTKALREMKLMVAK